MPAFCIFCGLCILTLFSLLTVNMRGVSNKHCLLPFFIYILITTYQKSFRLGLEVQCRVDFNSVTSDPRVHARGWG